MARTNADAISLRGINIEESAPVNGDVLQYNSATIKYEPAAVGGGGGGLVLGETSTTAYRGDRGKTAYDHSLLVTGNPHSVTKANVGLNNVDNTSDANKPVSTAQQTALDSKLEAGDITGKADKTNVLELDNTTAFTPNSDYEPATKKYVDDTSPTAGNMNSILLRSAAGQGSDGTANIAVQWNIEKYKDTGFTHNTVTNNSRIQVDNDGKYKIQGAVLYTGSTANYRFTSLVSLRVNGATILSENFSGAYLRAADGANYNQVSFSFEHILSDGDYVEVLSKRISTTTGDATIEAGTSVSVMLMQGAIGPTGAAGGLQSSDIGVTVQGYDADTTKNDVSNTFTGAQTFTTTRNTTGLEINAQTGTSYTPVLGDAGKLITLTNAGATTLTVPTNANEAFAVGVVIILEQLGAGQVTVGLQSGVTVNSKGGNLKITGQYSGAYLRKTATNIWILVGDLSA